MTQEYQAPKSRIIATDLRRLILSGHYKQGACLPPINNLMQQYDVSRSVVQAAHRILADEGLILCERGRGTFVSDYESGDSRLKQIVLIRNNILQSGYDYGRTQICTQFGLPCTTLDVCTDSPNEISKGIAMLRTRGLAGAVLDIDSRMGSVEEVSHWCEGLPIIFAHRYEWSPLPPANAVLIDFTSAYIMAARFLLGAGAKRLVFLAGHDQPPEYIQQRITATAAAVGMTYPSDNFLYLSHDPVSNNDLTGQAKRLRQIFTKDAPQTGIIGMGDYPVYQILQLYRMTFPDKKLPQATGMYNTNWSSQPWHPFHTFDPDWMQLWREVLARITDTKNSYPAPTFIVPKMIIRS